MKISIYAYLWVNTVTAVKNPCIHNCSCYRSDTYRILPGTGERFCALHWNVTIDLNIDQIACIFLLDFNTTQPPRYSTPINYFRLWLNFSVVSLSVMVRSEALIECLNLAYPLLLTHQLRNEDKTRRIRNSSQPMTRNFSSGGAWNEQKCREI